MLDAPYVDILQQHGFQLIGQLEYRLKLSVWWNPATDKLLQVVVLEIEGAVLIKGDKSYYLQSISGEGETWARDIGMLHDYLEGHFPELRISFSHFRDVPPEFARAEVRRQMAVQAPTISIPTVEQIGQLQRQRHLKQQDVQALDNLLTLSDTPSDLLTGHVRQQARSQQRDIDQLDAQIQGQRERLGLLQHLQREYEHKGSAAVYCFGISSHLQIAEDPRRFGDALSAVEKELTDQHRYQVMQKLQGGRLNIQVAQVEEPVIAWIEQWFGGALSPMQLRRIGPAFDPLRRVAIEHTMVMPDQPIVVDGHVQQAEKHLAARFVSTVLNRLDKTDAHGRNGQLDPNTIPVEAMPLRVGERIDEAGRTTGPALLPLAQVVHACISGTTGSGKSFLARVLVEEASMHKNLGILVLDPRNQFAGLLVPEDRPHILQQYERFGMSAGDARGFAFDYFAPELNKPLPEKLSALATGRSIVSFKGMDDQQRCLLVQRILDAAFNTVAVDESDRPRLLMVIDEAHLLTRRRVDESAKDAAAQAERALDRIAREGRKYGIVLILVSQTIKDFSYELASLRQMATTKIFLRNSDREIEYATDIIGDGRLLVQLPTGTALVHNANWGTLHIRVRPPYSKVFELADAQVRQLVERGDENSRVNTLSAEARRLFSLIEQHPSPPGPPLNMSRIAELADITSRRQLHELIHQLEQAGAIRTRKLPQRGQPRVVELADGSK